MVRKSGIRARRSLEVSSDELEVRLSRERQYSRVREGWKYIFSEMMRRVWGSVGGMVLVVSGLKVSEAEKVSEVGVLESVRCVE